jgi:hypothetical protein
MHHDMRTSLLLFSTDVLHRDRSLRGDTNEGSSYRTFDVSVATLKDEVALQKSLVAHHPAAPSARTPYSGRDVLQRQRHRAYLVLSYRA